MHSHKREEVKPNEPNKRNVSKQQIFGIDLSFNYQNHKKLGWLQDALQIS